MRQSLCRKGKHSTVNSSNRAFRKGRRESFGDRGVEVSCRITWALLSRGHSFRCDLGYTMLFFFCCHFFNL